MCESAASGGGRDRQSGTRRRPDGGDRAEVASEAAEGPSWRRRRYAGWSGLGNVGDGWREPEMGMEMETGGTRGRERVGAGYGAG